MAVTSPLTLPPDAVLVIVDMQKAIDAPYWGPRNNPMAEANAAARLAAWRARGSPIYHIRHDSREPTSAYRPGQPGHDFKDEVRPLEGETVVAKTTNSAFIGTDLEARLRNEGRKVLVMLGVLTNNSIEATARMAGNLGFATHVVSDACFAVDKRRLDGLVVAAEDVHALSLANLSGEYARIVDTREVLRALA
jgi:nicotinamidase-related amidase